MSLGNTKLNNTKKSIEKNKRKVEELTAKIKEQEEQAREQEDAAIIKLVRKEMSYDEFVEKWCELMGIGGADGAENIENGAEDAENGAQSAEDGADSTESDAGAQSSPNEPVDISTERTEIDDEQN